MKLIPLGILLCFTFLNLGITLAKDGLPRNDDYSFWLTTINAIMVWALILWSVS